MAIRKEEIEHLAKLARLGLSESEKAKIAPDLASILEFVGNLSKVDTHAVEPLSGGTDLFNVFRSDGAALQKHDRKALLKEAPETKAHYCKVPRVLE